MGEWSTAADAGSAASNMSTAGSIGGNMVDTAGMGGETLSSAMSTSPQGFDFANAVNTAQPTTWDNIVSTVSEMYDGSNQNFGQALKGFGWNPKTVGYVGGKITDMASGARPQSIQPSPLNIVYQQPEDRRYAELYRRRGY